MKLCTRCNNTYIHEFEYCPMCGSVLERYEAGEQVDEKKKFSESSSDLY